MAPSWRLLLETEQARCYSSARAPSVPLVPVQLTIGHTTDCPPGAHLRATLYNTVRSGFSLGSAAQVGQELPCMLSNSQAGHPFVSD